MDATSLLCKLNSGEITPEQLVNNSISSIETNNARLNAAVEILKDDAKMQLQNLADGPLKGIPISMKECYAIRNKKITSGSKRMPPIICDADATVVKKLKEAGAVVVARGNTSEFLLGRETDNLMFGTTNNVFDRARTAGGSSGGDAALVASESVAFAIGTDIGGSCRYPALFNGITGFKPASGQISKEGVFPSAGVEFTETMNSPGILSRSVRDARMVYNVIGNKQLKSNSDISNVQLFISSDFEVKIKDASIQNALDASVNYFRTNNYSIKEMDIPESGKLYILFAVLMCAGFTNKIYEWSVTREGNKLSFIRELFSRWKGNPTISGELFSMLLPFNFLNPNKKKLQRTIDEVAVLRQKYYKKLGDNGVLILPTAGILAPMHKKFIPQYSKPGVIKIITPVSFCNVLNLSCITIPAYKFRANEKINPPGIQLVVKPGNEELLLNVAEHLEKELNN